MSLSEKLRQFHCRHGNGCTCLDPFLIKIQCLERLAEATLDYYFREGTGSARDREIGDEFHEAVMEWKYEQGKAK